MKRKRCFPILLSLAVSLMGCGKGDSATASPDGTNDGGGMQNPSVGSHAMGTIKSGGTTLAYVLDIGSGAVHVYMPSMDRYAGYINLTSGSYYGNLFYWSGASCTGTPFAGFTGEVGKTVLFDSINSAYYLVSSVYPNGTVVPYQSSSNGNSICTNSSGSVTAGWNNAALGILTVTSQPYDFAAIAPLSITYP